MHGIAGPALQEEPNRQPTTEFTEKHGGKESCRREERMPRFSASSVFSVVSFAFCAWLEERISRGQADLPLRSQGRAGRVVAGRSRSTTRS